MNRYSAMPSAPFPFGCLEKNKAKPSASWLLCQALAHLTILPVGHDTLLPGTNRLDTIDECPADWAPSTELTKASKPFSGHMQSQNCKTKVCMPNTGNSSFRPTFPDLYHTIPYHTIPYHTIP